MTANDDLFNDAILHATQIERAKAGEVQKMIRFLQREVYPDALKTYDTLMRNKNPGVKTKRFKNIVVSLQAILSEGIRENGKVLQKDLVNFGKAEMISQVKSISRNLPIDFAVDIPNIPALRSAMARPYQGHTTGQWLRRLNRGTQLEVQRQLTLGTTLGETIPQIKNRFKQVLRGTDIGMTRLARTSVNHVTTQAREMTYNENDDIISGVEYLATLDFRTSDICISLDGKIFEIDKGPRPPMHHQCRSTTIPVLKGFEEFGLKEPSASTRSSLDGQVSERKNYIEWLRTRSIPQQNEAIGIGKAQSWRRAGRPTKNVKFTDQQHRPLTVEEFADAL